MIEQRERHSFLVRTCHWLLAGSGLLLCFTGIGTMPLYPRFFINDIPGMGWSADMLLQLQLHYLFAAIFVAVGSFHLIYHLRRGQLGLLPQKGDWRESWRTIRAILTKSAEPHHGKFLAEQRLVYVFYLLLSGVLLTTGWLLALRQLSPQVFDPDLLQLVILFHLAGGLLFFTGFVLHLLAFLPKANRPLFLSMFHGRISRSYAQQRHPRWDEMSSEG